MGWDGMEWYLWEKVARPSIVYDTYRSACVYFVKDAAEGGGKTIPGSQASQFARRKKERKKERDFVMAFLFLRTSC